MNDKRLLISLACLMERPTGISTYAYNVVPQLEPLQPLLLSRRALGQLPYRDIPPDLSPEAGLKGHVRRLAWTQLNLPRLYQQTRASLLLTPLPEAPLWTGCRFVTCVFDLIPLRFPKKTAFATQYFKYWVPQVLSQAVHIICCSQSTARDLTQFYDIDRAKISVIYLSHDRENFKLDPVSASHQKQPYFLYVGRHAAHKNTLRVVEAFTEFSRRSSRDFELWLGGSRDRRYTPLLQEKIRAAGLESRVKFLDYVAYPDLPKLYTQATAFLFPSLWEGFGIPVLEAMACGTPVITSQLASLPEVAGDAALYVDPYCSDDIAAAMGAIATDSTLAKALSEKGQRQAQSFSWEKTGQETVSVLKQFL